MLIAFMRHLHGPVIFEPAGPGEPLCRIWLPAMGLFVPAVGTRPSLTLEEVGFIVERTKQDAIILRTEADDTAAWRFTLNIVMNEGGTVEMHEDYALYGRVTGDHSSYRARGMAW